MAADLGALAQSLAVIDTPEHRERQRRWNVGQAAGLAGLAKPDDGDERAYLSACVERQARSGEVIGVICRGCRCPKCGEQNYEWRLGCRCWTADDICGEGAVMEYGALVWPQGQDQDAPLRFMSRIDLLAAKGIGIPVVHHHTGEAVDLVDEKQEAANGQPT